MVKALALEQDGSILALASILAASGPFQTNPVAHFSATGAAVPVSVSGALTDIGASANGTFQTNSDVVFGGFVPVGRRGGEVRIQRDTVNNAVDPTFNSPPFFFDFATIPQSRSFAQAVIVQTDGKIVVGGAAFASSQNIFGVARANANGSLDSTFGNGGIVSTRFNGRDSVSALLEQPDGKIIAVGQSSSGDTSIPGSIAIARYLGR